MADAPSPHGLDSTHHTGIISDAQAPQFLKTDGSRQLAANLPVADSVTIDGVDLSVFYNNFLTHLGDISAHGHVNRLLDDSDVSVSFETGTNDIRIYGADGVSVASTATGLRISGAGVTGSGGGSFLGIRDNASVAVVPTSGYLSFSDDGIINVDASGANTMAFSVNQAGILHSAIGGKGADDHHTAFVGITTGASVVVPDANDRITFASSHVGLEVSGVSSTVTLGLDPDSIGLDSLGGTLSWIKLNKVGSSIADIAARSHTLLTDIGTNTHAQIDTHLASTSNPHGVTPAQLGLVIGSDVQAWDADLDILAGLAKTNGNFIVGNGTTWVVKSGSTARASLGLGSMATQNANSVSISGGSATSMTSVNSESLSGGSLLVSGVTTLQSVNIYDTVNLEASLSSPFGSITTGGYMSAGSGLGVTGNITVTGTVDGVDIASLSSAYNSHAANTSNPHAVTKSQVGLSLVENTALSTWAGTSNITTLGTIGTGTWQGTPIANGYVAGIDQNLLTTSSPTFAGLTSTNPIDVFISAIDETATPGRGISSQGGEGAGDTHGWAYPYGAKLSVYLGTSRNFEIMTTSYPHGDLVWRQYDPYGGAWVSWGRLLDNKSTVSTSGDLDIQGDGNIDGDLTVDTDTLFVNSATGHVGIGTTAPANKLDVALAASGAGKVLSIGNVNGGSFGGLGFDANGMYMAKFNNAAGIYLQGSTGNVGIGTTNPAYPLDVTGAGHFSGDLEVDSDLDVGAGLLFVDYSNANVGINTYAPDPQFALDVAGPIRGTVLVGPHAIQLPNAKAIFHFDGPDGNDNYTGDSRSHMGLRPTTETAVIYRPGKFGKAVQVAEATTNHVPNPSAEGSLSGWAVWYGNGTWDISYSTDSVYGESSVRIERTGSSAYGQVFIGNFWNSTACSLGQTWTGSFYYRVESASAGAAASLAFHTSTGYGSGDAASSSLIIDNKWHRAVVSRTVSSATSNVVCINLYLGRNAVVYIDGVQLEQKAYATPYCLSPGSMVSTSRGIVRLDDVVIGDRLLGSGGFNEVEAKWDVETDAYEIELSNGYKVAASAEHRFMATKWPWSYNETSGWIFRQVSDLDVGDFVKLSTLENVEQGADEPEMAYLLGYHGVSSDSGAGGKSVPDCVWSYKKGDLIAFLTGLVDSDGSVDTDGAIKIDSSSERLIDEIRLLSSMNLGVHGHISSFTDTNNFSGGARTMYRIRFTKADSAYLFSIGLVPNHNVKRERLQSSNEPKQRRREWAKVKSITPIGKQRLIDITVGPDHDFVAEGMVTHNCDGSLGDGHAWTGTAHASTSTRVAADLRYEPIPLNDRSFTVMAWIKADKIESGDQYIFSHYGAHAVDGYMHLILRNGVPYMGFYANDLPASIGLQAGNWYHLAFVYDNSTTKQYIYINGDLNASRTATGPYSPSSQTIMGIGVSSSGASPLGGFIDDFAILSEALDADTIRAIYESNAPVFAESSVHSFRAGRGTSIWADESGFWAKAEDGTDLFAIAAVDGESWGGTTLDAGDVMMGTGSSYAKWDKSTSTFSFVGDGSGLTAINGANIQTGTVTATQIASNTITASQIAANAITASELAANSVTSDNIVAGTIVASDIASGTITATQIAANAITASELAANSVSATHIVAGSITATEIASGTITADKIDVADLFAQNATLTGDLTVGSGGLISAGGGAVNIDVNGVDITAIGSYNNTNSYTFSSALHPNFAQVGAWVSEDDVGSIRLRFEGSGAGAVLESEGSVYAVSVAQAISPYGTAYIKISSDSGGLAAEVDATTFSVLGDMDVSGNIDLTGTVTNGTWQGTPIANSYVAGLDQNLLTSSSPTFAGLNVALAASGAGKVLSIGNVNGGSFGGLGFDANGMYMAKFNNAAGIYLQGSTGNVGIGTTNPGHKLHVSGDAQITSRLGVASDPGTYTFLANGKSRMNGGLGLNDDPGTYLLAVNGDCYLGNYVGIGTGATADRLTVAGNINVWDDVFADNIELEQSILLLESATNLSMTANNQARIYMKADKLVIAYNDGGTMKYRYIQLNGVTATWVYTTTAP